MWPSLSQTQEEAQTFIRPVVIVDSPYNNGMNPIVACVYHTLYAVWLCVNVFSCLQTLLYNQSNEHFHSFIFTYCQSFDSSRFICLISGAIWDKDAMMNFPCISQSSSKRQQKKDIKRYARQMCEHGLYIPDFPVALMWIYHLVVAHQSRNTQKRETVN